MKTYAVDVHIDVAKCYRIQAESKEDAERKVEEAVQALLYRPTPEVLPELEASGYETTDDYEVGCSGESNENGEIEYY
jgi:phosphoribosylformylglycinamidine (FGAM) synthase PurS component